MASTAPSTVAKPVIIMISVLFRFSRTKRIKSMPDTRGIL